MDLHEAIQARHSVRKYTLRDIDNEAQSELRGAIVEANRASGLNIQLCLNEATAFRGPIVGARFSNVKNYIAIVGMDDDSLDERGGYYGEQIVLRAQQLGLNTNWAGMANKKRVSKNAIVNPGERVVIVIAVGYGETQGTPHKPKPLEELCTVEGEMPDWFRHGVEAAQLGPSSMAQYKFRFELEGDTVAAVTDMGRSTKIDLGIAKCHFEIGAGETGWSWATGA